MTTATVNDPLVAAPRGSIAQALAFIAPHNPQRPDFLAAYLAELWAVCQSARLDFVLLVGQGIVETAFFTSSWWINRGNPAGLGVTRDPAEDAVSPVFATGAAAARAQAAHMLLYCTGQISGGSGLAPIDDPRYRAYVAAHGNTARVAKLSDLGGGNWATDPNYAPQIATYASSILSTPIPTNGGTPVPTYPSYPVAGLATQIVLPVPLVQNIIPAGQTNQRPGIKRQTPGFWVQHETANTNRGADADMHARYLLNGADGTQVSWHFSVDDHQIYQHIPINEVTWQAADGNGPGNMSGVSCEMCVNSDGNEATARHNTEALCAAICAALGLGIDRVKAHYDFNAADPNRHHCPDHMLSSGYWPDTFKANVSKLMGGTTPVPTPAPKPVVTYPAGMDAGIAAELFGVVGTWKYAEGGALSNLWLDYGKANGVWPRLIDVKLAIDSPTITRTYFQFSNGVVWWRPNANAPVVQLT